MARRGSGSKAKGSAFERKVARDFRLIFDGPKWVEHHEAMKPKARVGHLKTSKVRRGEQGKGAREADVIVDERRWWFELQHADKFQPLKKLEQAEKDIRERADDDGWYPIAICLQTGRHTTWAMMRAYTFVLLTTGRMIEEVSVRDAPVMIRYEDLLVALEHDAKR